MLDGKPALLRVSHDPKKNEVRALGKYWGWRMGAWYKVQVTELSREDGADCGAGGFVTGGLVFAPIDRRGYPYAKSAALCACDVLWGPVKAWGEVPPEASKAALLEKGASAFWLK